RGKPRERILGLEASRQPADYDEPEDGNQRDADDDAELFGRHREDEIGMRIGKDALHRPLARTLAEPAAAQDRFQRGVDLERVPRGRRNEAVDTAGDMRQRGIGGDDTARRRGAEAGDPDPRHAGHEEERPPCRRDQHGLAEIGFGDEQRDDHRQQDEREEIGRDVGAALALREEPRDNDDEGRLHELGRLDGNAGNVDPAAGALDLDADKERRHQENQHDADHEERGAPDLTRREEGRRNHPRQRRQEEEEMPLDEMEAVVIAESFGDGRARGKRQDDAAEHQGDKAGKENLVDRPPPFRKARALGAADHQAASPFLVIPSSERTSARNWSPRFSKFWNWSYDAQAGESRTTGSLAPSTDASRAAAAI